VQNDWAKLQASCRRYIVVRFREASFWDIVLLIGFIRRILEHTDGWQHKGTMSTKPVFVKIAKIQRSYVSYSRYVIDICAANYNRDNSNDVTISKTRTFVQLLPVSILRYFVDLIPKNK